MSRMTSKLTLLFSAYFAFSLLGLIDASEYSYDELVQRMLELEKKVDHGFSEKTTTHLQLSRQVKILESRIAGMMMQQVRSNRKQKVLQTRISQLEEQVINNERTIENQQSEIESLKINQERFDWNTPDSKNEHNIHLEMSRKESEMRRNSSNAGLSGWKIRRSFPEAPVAFTAVLDHNVDHFGIDQTVVFNKILLNDGNAYNAHTGVFTVPREGVYMFYLAFAAGADAHRLWMHIVVDGQGKVAGVADTLQLNHDAQGTNCVLLHVNKGDSVWVSTFMIADAEIYGSQGFTTFSGILLYEY